LNILHLPLNLGLINRKIRGLVGLIYKNPIVRFVTT
jgi:hypothetical protein